MLLIVVIWKAINIMLSVTRIWEDVVRMRSKECRATRDAGTKNQWNNISKDSRYWYGQGEFLIHCIDGEISSKE